jgi:hypothetical protein
VRAEHHVSRQAGGQAALGVQHVRRGRQRVHIARRDARDRLGHLQDGGQRDAHGRRRVHAREAHRQDLQEHGQEPRRQHLDRRVHRGRQGRPEHRAPLAIRPEQQQQLASRHQLNQPMCISL